MDMPNLVIILDLQEDVDITVRKAYVRHVYTVYGELLVLVTTMLGFIWISTNSSL